MVSYDIHFRIEKLDSCINELKSLLNEVKDLYGVKDSLWDNSDMVRYFKVSERTLASWRSMGLISYSKISGKIYYTRRDRDRFLKNFKVPIDESFVNEKRRAR